MARSTPLWRRAFDVAERAIGSRLEEVVQTERFGNALAVAAQLRAEARRRAERTTRRWLHAWNLPAASDLSRLHEQLGRLERQMRDLSKHVEQLEKEP